MAWSVQCGWDDVPHISEAEKALLLKAIPLYQHGPRTKGVPRLGAGAIYPIPHEEDILCDRPRDLMPYWPEGYGLDVGWQATAAVRCAKDVDADCIYVLDEYKRAEAEPAVHIARVESWYKKRGRMKGAIDPASRGRGQRDGVRLVNDYIKGGLYLELAENAVEAGIFEVYTRLTEGRLKISRHCTMLLAELGIYHRDKHGNVVKKFDHLLDALRYIVMTPKAFTVLQSHREPLHVVGSLGSN